MEIHCAYDQLVRVADLKPHPKNPNTHSAAQVAAIAAVIEGNGWREPITVSNRSGLITCGDNEERPGRFGSERLNRAVLACRTIKLLRRSIQRQLHQATVCNVIPV